jgi:hypothetical protein
MSAGNFSTQNDTYRKLMGNGLLYQVPRFQRDYSWTEEEWRDLWNDVLEVLTDTGGSLPMHYMGYLVLQSSDQKRFDVIDGQQRLTTISILILAVLKNLQDVAASGEDTIRNREREAQIRGTYIGYKNPVTLTVEPKLTLNRVNNPYYKNHLVELTNLPERGFAASVKSLKNAFEWFAKQIEKHFRSHVGNRGEELARLVERIADGLFFTVMNVSDQINAYKVFETLNARGVRLSATDLLKNYFFSVLDKSGATDVQFDTLDERWNILVSRLAEEDFPKFVRAFWLSRYQTVRQQDLFKSVSSKCRTGEEVFATLRALETAVDDYVALRSPRQAIGWSQSSRENCQLLKTFNVQQPIPMLLSARSKFDEGDFEKIIHAVVVITMRYNVIGSLPTPEQEDVYHGVARQIWNGECASVISVLNELADLYPSDGKFRADFADKILPTGQSRNARVAKYILGELERQLGGPAIDVDSDELTIEHVLPQQPDSQSWPKFSDRNVDLLRFRFGNMTLLRRRANLSLGNVDYTKKREAYLESEFLMTRQLAASDDWTPDGIEARSKKLAKVATSIWRVGQLSQEFIQRPEPQDNRRSSKDNV